MYSLPGGLSLYSLGKVSASPLPPAPIYLEHFGYLLLSRASPWRYISLRRTLAALFCIDLARCFLSSVNKGKVVPGKDVCKWKLHIVMCNGNVLSRPHYEEQGNCTFPVTAIEWMWAVTFLDERRLPSAWEMPFSRDTRLLGAPNNYRPLSTLLTRPLL